MFPVAAGHAKLLFVSAVVIKGKHSCLQKKTPSLINQTGRDCINQHQVCTHFSDFDMFLVHSVKHHLCPMFATIFREVLAKAVKSENKTSLLTLIYD